MTVRTRTIDLKVLLGGGTDGDGKDIGVDLDGSLNFSPLDWVAVATAWSMQSELDMVVVKG